jgi:peptidase E
MGSGEMTATMVEVHKALLSRYGKDAQAVFIDTPAGFQLNVDHLSQRAVAYFRDRVRHPLTPASLKSAQVPEIELERTYQLLRAADYILVGPGSPTYALEQWGRTRVPQLLSEHIRSGGTLVAASAAALTIGRFTLPVYEIYKVGREPYWAEGLDVLQAFEMDLAVMPHWNNAEGGNHDTRYCFMGKSRFERLESMLPETTAILGLDEHTALVVDLDRNEAEVHGLGRVILRHKGRERIFEKQDRFPLALLRGEKGWTAPSRTPLASDEPAVDRPAATDEVWDPIPVLAETVQASVEGGRIDQAFETLLKLERHLWDFQEPLQERNALGAARELLRELLALIGARLAHRPVDRAACMAPLVEELLSLRAHFRDGRQWHTADLLRDALQRAGVRVEDTPKAGSVWRIEGGPDADSH